MISHVIVKSVSAKETKQILKHIVSCIEEEERRSTAFSEASGTETFQDLADLRLTFTIERKKQQMLKHLNKIDN
jgi:hypothetical protein